MLHKIYVKITFSLYFAIIELKKGQIKQDMFLLIIALKLIIAFVNFQLGSVVQVKYNVLSQFFFIKSSSLLNVTLNVKKSPPPGRY